MEGRWLVSFPYRLLVSTHGRYVVAAGPEVLTGEVPAPAHVVAGDVDRALTLSMVNLSGSLLERLSFTPVNVKHC